MGSEISNYKCPACTGPMHFSAQSGNVECDYCGSVYSVEEVEKIMQEENEKALANSASKNDGDWDFNAKEWIDEDMKSYSCPSCGAELVCDETTAATSCPYCGNTTIVPAQFDGILKPEYVVPFKLEKAQAIERLKLHYKGKVLLPKSFKDNNHIQEIKGMYVPFWLYDGIAKGAATYDAIKEHKERKGKEEITISEHFKVNRAGEVAFSKIPADASSKMPDDMMDSLEPFDYSELKEFSKAYMAGYIADKYDVEAKDVDTRVKERASNTLKNLLRDSVSGYSSVTETASNVVVKDGKISYAMMPIWMLCTKWDGKDFMFAMNGQTGKMVGDLPADKKKFWGIMALTYLLTVVLTFMLGGSMGFFSDMSLFSILFAAVIMPVIVMFIVGSVLMGQLKSVFTATVAYNYVSDGGLNLSKKTDLYTHTTRSVRIIEDKK